MSDFLNELRKNAKTEEEFLSQQKINEANLKKEREKELLQKQIEEQKKYEDFMMNFAQDIKKLCIEAVNESCYINIAGNRCILCEFAFMHSFKFEGGEWGSSSHNSYTLFRCFKLEHDSIFSSKRVYKIKSIRNEFSAPGCKQCGSSHHYETPGYLNLSALIKKYIDGYVDIIELPKKIVDKNYPGRLGEYGGVSFVEAMSSICFAIKF